MSILVNRIAPPFDLALGEEEGERFVAILWPSTLGKIAYRRVATAHIVNDGFVLTGEPGEDVIAFLGVSQEILDVMIESNVTILRQVSDDYEQIPVQHPDSSISVHFDFSSAL